MSNEIPEKFNKCLLYLLIFLMVLTGSLNTILMKCIQKLESLGEAFEGHHWFSTQLMFLAELLPLFYYIYFTHKRKKQNLISSKLKNNDEIQEEEAKKKPPIPTNLIFAITAGCDLLGNVASILGLTYLSSSLFQMMKGFLLFFICLFSKILLNNPIYRHHILGVCSLIIGLILVGISSIINSDKDSNIVKHPLIGAFLIIVSQFFTSGVYVFEEKFIKLYDIIPSQIVGFEGLWGLSIFTILLIIFQFIPCDDWDIKDDLCTRNDDKKYYMENSIFALKQMWNNKTILILYFFYVISVCLYNIVGVNLTKLVSSAARAVVDNGRTVSVWLFFLIFNPVPGTKENFRVVQFIGLLFIVFGTLVYNEIIVLPFCGLDYDIRQKIVERDKENLIKKLEEEEDEEKLYISIKGKDNIIINNI